MTNSNLPARPSTSDVANAEEVINRHSTTQPSVEGVASGAEVALPDVSGLGAADVDGEIRKITALAHTGDMRDEDAYQRLQPRLQALIQHKTSLMRGGVSMTSARTAPDKPGAAAHNLMDYPSLPDDQSLPAEQYRQDAALWNKALPALRDAGVTPKQARVMIDLIRASEGWRAELEASHRDQVQMDTRRALRQRYGEGYQRHIDTANRFMRNALPNGRSRQLAHTLLADGSRLGDSMDFIRLLVEFGREVGQ